VFLQNLYKKVKYKNIIVFNFFETSPSFIFTRHTSLNVYFCIF